MSQIYFFSSWNTCPLKLAFLPLGWSTPASSPQIMNNVWLIKNNGGQSSRSPEPWSHHDKVQVNRDTELDWEILNRLEFLWLNPSIFQKFVLYLNNVLWIDVENEFMIQVTHQSNWKKIMPTLISLLLFAFLRKILFVPLCSLAWLRTQLCCSGLPWTSNDPPDLASWGLGLLAWATPGLIP